MGSGGGGPITFLFGIILSFAPGFFLCFLLVIFFSPQTGVYLLPSPLTFLLQWGSEIWLFALLRYCLLSHPSTWLPPRIWFRAPPPPGSCLLISWKSRKLTHWERYQMLTGAFVICSEDERDPGTGAEVERLANSSWNYCNSQLNFLKGSVFCTYPFSPSPTLIRIYFNCSFCFKLFGIAGERSPGRLFAWKGIVRRPWQVTTGKC